MVQEFLAGDEGSWTIVYRSGDPCLFAGFAPLSSVPAILQDYNWDVRRASGGPSLWWTSDGEVGYDRSFGDDGCCWLPQWSGGQGWSSCAAAGSMSNHSGSSTLTNPQPEHSHSQNKL